MNKLLALGAAALASAALLPAAVAAADDPVFDSNSHTSTLAVFGDAPYGTSNADTAQFNAFPAFVDTINNDPDVGLVIHVGDIHSGKQACAEAYDNAMAGLFARFDDPLVYTPGDNEWTDCHKSAERPGSYADGNPVANLALVRSLFFPAAGQTLGAHARTVLSQAQVDDPAHPGDKAYVENVMWAQSHVLFVTVNIPGGSNDDADVWYGAPTATQEQLDEVAARDGADLRWLNLAFGAARELGVKGVVIGTQADMWDLEKGPGHLTNYEPFVKAIADGTRALRRPVLLFNGDSHSYLSDNPLSPADPLSVAHPGYDVPNFHRVVVHGSTAPMEWLKLTVDPRAKAANGDDAFGPFSWQREIQALP